MVLGLTRRGRAGARLADQGRGHGHGRRCSLGLVGIDVNTGAPRMTFGIPELADGIGFVPIAIGLFGIAEMPSSSSGRRIASPGMRQSPTCGRRARNSASAFPAMVRGTAVGCVLGVLPGGGAALPPFAAYALEKKIAARPVALRQGRHRRRRRAGGRQQRRRADELHPDADARHPGQRR